MTLVKVQRDEDGIDISNIGIYRDTHTGQFRYKITCPECGVDTAGCQCYDSIYDAVSDSSIEWYCSIHYIQQCWFDMELWDLIDKVTGSNVALLCMNRYRGIQDGELYPNASVHFIDDKLEECYTEINTIIKSLTDEQATAIVSEIECDADLIGDSCEV